MPILIFTAFVSTFLLPAAILPIAFRFTFIRTVERIKIAEYRAIARNVARVQKPREVGSRSWFLITAETTHQNSGIIGK